MAASGSREPSIRFDLFELDLHGCQLRRSGLPVDLPPQAFRILALLAARPNELVTRSEIKRTLWPDESYGDFDGRLNFAVKKLREGLGDHAEQSRYILTERKAGYRFIAPVLPVRDVASIAGATLVAPPGPAITPAAPAAFRFGQKALFVVLIALAAAVSVGSYVLRGRRTDPAVLPYTTPVVVSADDSRPEISSVTPILPKARQRIVIKGRGFGLHVPYARTDTPYLAIRDDTANWAAGRLVPHNWDEVMLDVESWRDDEIVISGFSGDYGKNGWKLAEGDAIEVAVWNPQNGAGPALFHMTVSSTKSEK